MVMVLDLLRIRVGVGNVNCSSRDNEIHSLVLISCAHRKWMQKYLHSRLKQLWMQIFLHSCLKIFVNADISAFTLEQKFANADIFAFTFGQKFMNADNFCIHVWPKFVNADISAFTLGQKFVNADIFAFTFGQNFVNEYICAFTLGQKILECRHFCIPKSRGKWAKRNADISAFWNWECRNWCIHNQYLRNCLNVNADNSAFTLRAPLTRLVNADISAFSTLTHYNFCLSKLAYTCTFNRLDFHRYYDA